MEAARLLRWPLTWGILVISGRGRKLSPILSQSRRDQSDTRGRTSSTHQISSRLPDHRNFMFDDGPEAVNQHTKQLMPLTARLRGPRKLISALGLTISDHSGLLPEATLKKEPIVRHILRRHLSHFCRTPCDTAGGTANLNFASDHAAGVFLICSTLDQGWACAVASSYRQTFDKLCRVIRTSTVDLLEFRSVESGANRHDLRRQATAIWPT